MENGANQSIQSGGKFLPAFCNVVGIAILLAVILSALPLAVPPFFGYTPYHVVSGSMEPALPVHSVVYAKVVAPEDIVPGDIIAFHSNGIVVTHRVVKNQVVEGRFTTKGDANAEPDPESVSYGALVGRIVYHLPYIGSILTVYSSAIGKLYMLLLAASGLLLHILGNRIRERRRLAVERKLRHELAESAARSREL